MIFDFFIFLGHYLALDMVHKKNNVPSLYNSHSINVITTITNSLYTLFQEKNICAEKTLVIDLCQPH